MNNIVSYNKENLIMKEEMEKKKSNIERLSVTAPNLTL